MANNRPTRKHADANKQAKAPEALRDEQPKAGRAGRANGTPADVNAKAEPRQPPVNIDSEFQSYLHPLSPTEAALLEQSLVSEGGARDPLVVWGPFRILLDGHHRHEICHRFCLPYRVREVELPDRAAALDWIERNQGGRRNDTPEARSYRRGRHYIEEKKPHGGNRREGKAGGQDDHLKTEERLAALYKVSARTIGRDAEFAEAVDLLTSRCGVEIRRFILTRQGKLSRQAVLRLSRLTAADQRQAVERLLKTGKAYIPSAKAQACGMRVPADPQDLAWFLVLLWDKEQLQEFSTALAHCRKKRKTDEFNPLEGMFA